MTRVARQGYTVDRTRKAKPYKVMLSVNGKNKYIGNYATPLEAIAAYKKARAEYPMVPTSSTGFSGHTHAKMAEKRCKFCGEYRTVNHMQRHVRSCKYAQVDKI